MDSKKLKKLIGEKELTGFDLDAWMKTNFNYTGNREEAIDLLIKKERYKNLLNDADWKKGGADNV